jgi:hypothetical protein
LLESYSKHRLELKVTDEPGQGQSVIAIHVLPAAYPSGANALRISLVGPGEGLILRNVDQDVLVGANGEYTAYVFPTKVGKKNITIQFKFIARTAAGNGLFNEEDVRDYEFGIVLDVGENWEFTH